jgi:hypothetical protein
LELESQERVPRSEEGENEDGDLDPSNPLQLEEHSPALPGMAKRILQSSCFAVVGKLMQFGRNRSRGSDLDKKMEAGTVAHKFEFEVADT